MVFFSYVSLRHYPWPHTVQIDVYRRNSDPPHAAHLLIDPISRVRTYLARQPDILAVVVGGEFHGWDYVLLHIIVTSLPNPRAKYKYGSGTFALNVSWKVLVG